MSIIIEPTGATIPFLQEKPPQQPLPPALARLPIKSKKIIELKEKGSLAQKLIDKTIEYDPNFAQIYNQAPDILQIFDQTLTKQEKRDLLINIFQRVSIPSRYRTLLLSLVDEVDRGDFVLKDPKQINQVKLDELNNLTGTNVYNLFVDQRSVGASFEDILNSPAFEAVRNVIASLPDAEAESMIQLLQNVFRKLSPEDAEKLNQALLKSKQAIEEEEDEDLPVAGVFEGDIPSAPEATALPPSPLPLPPPGEPSPISVIPETPPDEEALRSFLDPEERELAPSHVASQLRTDDEALPPTIPRDEFPRERPIDPETTGALGVAPFPNVGGESGASHIVPEPPPELAPEPPPELDPSSALEETKDKIKETWDSIMNNINKPLEVESEINTLKELLSRLSPEEGILATVELRNRLSKIIEEKKINPNTKTILEEEVENIDRGMSRMSGRPPPPSDFPPTPPPPSSSSSSSSSEPSPLLQLPTPDEKEAFIKNATEVFGSRAKAEEEADKLVNAISEANSKLKEFGEINEKQRQLESEINESREKLENVKQIEKMKLEIKQQEDALRVNSRILNSKSSSRKVKERSLRSISDLKKSIERMKKEIENLEIPGFIATREFDSLENKKKELKKLTEQEDKLRNEIQGIEKSVKQRIESFQGKASALEQKKIREEEEMKARQKSLEERAKAEPQKPQPKQDKPASELVSKIKSKANTVDSVVSRIGDLSAASMGTKGETKPTKRSASEAEQAFKEASKGVTTDEARKIIKAITEWDRVHKTQLTNILNSKVVNDLPQGDQDAIRSAKEKVKGLTKKK
jgi:hypothetical protein